jgi:hypothetical protein
MNINYVKLPVPYSEITAILMQPAVATFHHTGEILLPVSITEGGRAASWSRLKIQHTFHWMAEIVWATVRILSQNDSTPRNAPLRRFQFSAEDGGNWWLASPSGTWQPMALCESGRGNRNAFPAPATRSAD